MAEEDDGAITSLARMVREMSIVGTMRRQIALAVYLEVSDTFSRRKKSQASSRRRDLQQIIN